MTTNSPNPVDGDVQALIADCKAEIDSLKWKIERTRESGGTLVYLESCLKRQQIALAALTAEPETPACFVTYWPDTDDESYRPHSESNESCARRIAGEIGGYVRPCFILDDGMKAYTTPPAQLLRPVEKPTTKCIGWVKESIQEHDEKWISAIREAGYEVKND